MDSNKYYIGKEFLDMPKPHHHVSRLLVLLIVLGVVVAISAGGYYLFSTQSHTPVSIAPVVEDAHAQAVAKDVARGDMALGNMGSSMTPEQYKNFMDVAAKSFKSKSAWTPTAADIQKGDAALGNLKVN